MRVPTSVVLGLLLAAAVSSGAPAPTPDAAHAGSSPPAVPPQALMAHIRFLADDLLEGRGAGTRGYDLAALYVATQFEAMGLAPAGAGDSYLQQVPLRAATLVPEGTRFEWRRGARGEALEYGRDFVANANFHRDVSEVRAPVVFVGYGVTAPGLGHDDYAGVDVAGKVVALLFGAPRSFPDDQRAHYGQTLNKLRDAASRGALGTLLVRQPRAEQIFRWERVVQHSRHPSMRWLDAGGAPSDAPEQIQAAVGLSVEATERLFAAAGRPFPEVMKDVEEGRFRAFDLGIEAQVRTETRHEELRSPNVAALLRGSDAALASETVAFSAHLDHLGVGEAQDNDAVYNGAYDNASGVAALIEVARLFAGGPRPRRSVLFLAVTAEERGLLGSDYFARHPTVPGIVANVNLDEVPMLGPIGDLVAYGAEHSSLGQVVAAAAREAGLAVSPDPWPEQAIFVRSDHYSFVRRGIPAVYLWPTFKSAGTQGDGTAEGREWLKQVYHTPKDDLSQAFDTASGARFVLAVYLTGRAVADADARPRWNAGDFFGETFGRGLEAAEPRERAR